MKSERTVDLTHGNVWKILLAYSLPLFGSAMVQQLYSLVDLLIVGNFATNGELAVAAIGNATVVVNILLAFALGINAGCSVIVAHYFGKGENKSVRETVSTSVISSLGLCAFIMLLGFVFATPLLNALNVEGVYFADCLSYLNIYIVSLPFVFMYNLGNGICTALGDSKTPFLFLVASSVLNIVLDVLFVSVFKWDVAGAAWATLISQAFATVLTVFVLLKKLKAVKTEEKSVLFNKRIFISLVKSSVPVMMQNSFVSVGNLFVTSKINAIGTFAIVGFTAAFKLISMANTGVFALTGGLANFCSQNKAAGEYARIKQGYLAVLSYALITSVIFVTIFVAFPEPLIRMFINEKDLTKEALDCAMQFLVLVACFLPVVCVKIVSDGVVRGCGGNLGFTISTFTDLILRVALVYILVDIGMGFAGVCWAWNIGWSVSLFVAFAFYLAIPCLKGVKYFKKT